MAADQRSADFPNPGFQMAANGFETRSQQIVHREGPEVRQRAKTEDDRVAVREPIQHNAGEQWKAYAVEGAGGADALA